MSKNEKRQFFGSIDEKTKRTDVKTLRDGWDEKSLEWLLSLWKNKKHRPIFKRIFLDYFQKRFGFRPER